MAHIRLDFRSSSVMKMMNLHIFLPVGDGKEDAAPPFRTLYFLPGFSDGADQIGCSLPFWQCAMQHGIAVVVTEGDNSFYVDRPMQAYSAYIREMVDFTRKLLPLSSRREDTFLAGTSMGGFGAMYNGLRHMELFGKLGILNPGFDIYDMVMPGSDEPVLDRQFLDARFGSREAYVSTDFSYEIAFSRAAEKDIPLPELFCACGKQDLLVDRATQRFRHFLENREIPYVWAQPDGGHDDLFLMNVLPELFDFLNEN